MTDAIGAVLESTIRGFFLAVLNSPPKSAAANPGVAGGCVFFSGGVVAMFALLSG